MKKIIALLVCFNLILGLCGCTKLSGDISSVGSTIVEEIIIDSEGITTQIEQSTNDNNTRPSTNDKNNQGDDSVGIDTETQNNQDDNSQDSSDETADNNSNHLQETTNSNASKTPKVTIFTAVAKDTYIVGGKCTADTEYISISGNDVKATQIKPIISNDGAYFIGQAKFTASTMIDIRGKQKGKEPSDALSMFALYDDSQKNLMTADDYKPYFAADTRMHFYSAILSYTLSNKVNTAEKTAARQNISDVVNAAKANNAEVIYLVVPSSVAVYPETLPEYKAASGESIYKAFEKIATECGAKVIYPLDTMKAHKDEGNGYKIYHHTDSHWTTYGAYWGVSELMNYISSKYPSAKPRTKAEMDFYTAELYGGDALFSFGDNNGFENYSKADANGGVTLETEIKELSTLYKLKMPTDTLTQITRGKKSSYITWDNSTAYTFTNSAGKNLPTAVVVRDSFGRTAFDMVNDRFSKVDWLDEGDYTSVINKINSNTNYVIYIVSERNLLKVMLNNKDASLTAKATK